MIKFEMHAHTKGGSYCAYSDAKTLIDDYKKGGYGGIVITNHFSASNYVVDLIGETHKEKIDYFFSLYHNVKDEGKKHGIKVFYGVEVRDCFGDEYMLLGFKPEFLYDNKPLFTYSQKELFYMAEKNNIFMYQTHPFRDGVRCGNPNYLHGAEAFNGHFHHFNNNEKAKAFVEKNNLISLAGTDYHTPNQPLTAYMLIPENINDEFALVEYLRSGKAEYFGDEQYYIDELKKYKGIK
ncbi:MAG: PHP domain-containing protein [Clostridia bacterium]|nr:PHP domain-containing protein [Clostridia bacterium]